MRKRSNENLKSNSEEQNLVYNEMARHAFQITKADFPPIS